MARPILVNAACAAAAGMAVVAMPDTKPRLAAMAGRLPVPLSMRLLLSAGGMLFRVHARG